MNKVCITVSVSDSYCKECCMKRIKQIGFQPSLNSRQMLFALPLSTVIVFWKPLVIKLSSQSNSLTITRKQTTKMIRCKFVER
jgi:hypothetical protein